VQVRVDALHEGCLAGSCHAYADNGDGRFLLLRAAGGGHGEGGVEG
jgi:hypothetical protein